MEKPIAKNNWKAYLTKMSETKYTEKQCPKCGQQLRFPNNTGGMLMACPSCGNKFYTDFKLGSASRNNPKEYRNIATSIFGLPYELCCRIYRFFTQ